MPNERHTPAQGTAAAWRMVYRFALYLLLPLALARLWWRGRRVPAYRRRWAERLGCIAPLPSAGAVWVHAVSVGETVAAAPLIKWLLARGETVLVTTTTPSGSDRVRALFGQDVHHCYCPYDLPGAPRTRHGNRTVAQPVSYLRGGRRAGDRRQCPHVGALVSRLSALRHADAYDPGRGDAAGGAGRGRRRAATCAGRGRRASERQHQIRLAPA